MADEQFRRGFYYFSKELCEAVGIFFILVINRVSQLADKLPSLGGFKYAQFFHEGKYRTEAFRVNFFLDGNRTHGFAKVFLKLAKTDTECREGFVLFQGQCSPVCYGQNSLCLFS